VGTVGVRGVNRPNPKIIGATNKRGVGMKGGRKQTEKTRMTEAAGTSMIEGLSQEGQPGGHDRMTKTSGPRGFDLKR